MADGLSAVATGAVRPMRTADEVAVELDKLEDWLGLDVDSALAGAVAAQRDAEALGDPELIQRARLALADVWDRKGEVASGVRILWDVNRWAAEHDCRSLLSRSHLLLARAYYNLGDLAACLEHSVCSVELLDEDTPTYRRAFYLAKLADALGWNGSFDAARERYRQAERLAVEAGDIERQVLVLNNLAYTEYEAGAPGQAWEVVQRMLAVAAEHGWELNTNKLDTIARIQIALGRYAEAEQTSLVSIRDYHSRGYEEADAVPEYLLTLAIAQRHLGAFDRAQASLDRSRVLCEERGLAEVIVRIQQEQAELYAAVGDHERAFELYRAFHAEAEELRSRQREAQARTRQFMFETTEARQEAERFREQANRDPLTGLRNRRYLDDQLPGLIAHAVQSGSPLVVALADLDHFKQINDTLSHDVGDHVLVTVADLLTDELGAISEAGFVARMGGEEFLIVLPDTSPADGLARLEQVRVAIASHPWRPIVGDLPVTISIGATSTDSGGNRTQAAVLADADRNLYAAKHGGRDRVVTDHGRRRRHRDETVVPHDRGN